MKLVICIIINSFVLNYAIADDPTDFAEKIYQITLKSDYTEYSKLFHSQCDVKEITAKSFLMRSKILNTLKPGIKIEAMPIAKYRTFKKKTGNPFEEIYTFEPSHIAIVWGQYPALADGKRVEMNPIVKMTTGWRILEGSCISSRKR